MDSLKMSVARISVFFCLCMLLTGVLYSQTKSIIFVGDTSASPYQGVNTDEGWVTFLQGKGYTVTRALMTMRGQLSETQKATLNAADLVVISRLAASTSYSFIASWDSIVKPIIQLNTYLVRAGAYCKWINSTSIQGDGGSPKTKIIVPSHAIFNGITIPSDSLVQVLDTTAGTGNTSLIKTNAVGNGQLLATNVDYLTSINCAAIVYWTAGNEFYTGAGHSPMGKRMYFNAGTRENLTKAPDAGVYNLTADGAKIFVNAVNFMLGSAVNVEKQDGLVPGKFSLLQNYPNPFNPTTMIEYHVPVTGNVGLKIYDVMGREVATLVQETKSAGVYTVQWNADNYPSGIYLARLTSGIQAKSIKLILMK